MPIYDYEIDQLTKIVSLFSINFLSDHVNPKFTNYTLFNTLTLHDYITLLKSYFTNRTLPSVLTIIYFMISRSDQ